MALVPTAVEKMRVALELAELSRLVMRQNLRRRSPDATEAEIDRQLGVWQRTRPGAEDGDAVGKRVDPVF